METIGSISLDQSSRNLILLDKIRLSDPKTHKTLDLIHPKP